LKHIEEVSSFYVSRVLLKNFVAKLKQKVCLYTLV